MGKKKRIIEVTAEVVDGGFKFRIDDVPHDLKEYVKQEGRMQLTRTLRDGRVEFTAGDVIIRVTPKVDTSFEDVSAIVNAALDKTDNDWTRATVMLCCALAEAQHHAKVSGAEVARMIDEAREHSPIGEVQADDQPPPDKPTTLQLH